MQSRYDEKINLTASPLTHFIPLVSLDTPRNFWCIQGVSKETIGMKWVKQSNHKTTFDWKQWRQRKTSKVSSPNFFQNSSEFEQIYSIVFATKTSEYWSPTIIL